MGTVSNKYYTVVLKRKLLFKKIEKKASDLNDLQFYSDFNVNKL